jgi:hypothetical protein
VAEVAYWSNSPESSTATPHVETATPAIRILDDALNTFEFDAEVLPNVRALDASGHTPGHTAFAFESHGTRLFSVGDSFYDSLQLNHPQWRTPVGSRGGGIGPEPTQTAGTGGGREPPRARLPHALSGARPRRTARRCLRLEAGRAAVTSLAASLGSPSVIRSRPRRSAAATATVVG